MERQGLIWWKCILYGSGVLLLAAILFPILARAPEPPHRISCSNNLRQIGLALMMYSQDSDNKYPLIASTSESNVMANPQDTPPKCYGWADILWPYVKNRSLFQCPAQSRNTSASQNVLPTEHGFTDYWLNTGLGGLIVKTSNMGPSTIITMGDGNDGDDLTDARYNLPALPATWINDTKSPAYRHTMAKYANYAFLDGHVKALPPSKITNEPLANGKPTFSVK